MPEDIPAAMSRADELRDLGFPEAVVAEVVRADERGLFDRKPSPGMLERTMERCRDLLARGLEPSPDPRDPGGPSRC